MNVLSPLRVAPVEEPPLGRHAAVVGREPSSSTAIAIASARKWLADQQHADGSWCGRREADPSYTARLILLWQYLDRDVSDVESSFIDRLFDQQLPEGGWAKRPGGSADLSVSVLVYAAIKLCGGAQRLPALKASLQKIKSLGGAAAADAEALGWLALFGQCPDSQSGDSADGQVALALAVAEPRPVSPLNSVRELFGDSDKRLESPGEPPALSDSIALLWRRIAATATSEDGDRAETAALDEQIAQRTDNDFGYMPEISALRDTTRAVASLVASGLDCEQSVVRRGVAWLVEAVADDIQRLPTCDLAAVLTTLGQLPAEGWNRRSQLPPWLKVVDEGTEFELVEDRESLVESVRATRRGLAAELTSRQRPDGGWGDRADGPAGLSTTAAAVAALATRGDCAVASAVERGLAWLKETQALDGSWCEEASAATVTETAQAMGALVAAGVEPDDEALLAGVNWLLAMQGETGGWGPAGTETCSVAATSTAFAVTALTQAGFANQFAVSSAVDRLLDTQEATGEWTEGHFAAGDHRNELEPVTVALEALSLWTTDANHNPAMDEPVCLRLAKFDTVEA